MKDRLGFDAPPARRIEESLAWAAASGFRWVDFNADTPLNALETFDSARVASVRDLCERGGIRLAIHPSSAVNCAEVTPIMARASDDYLRANLDLAKRLGCAYVIVHGGYHFSADAGRRMEAAIQRLRRAIAWAGSLDMPLYLENHNREPDDAEIHYMPHTIAEYRRFFEELRSPLLKWSFNIAHAHLEPEGIGGFLDAFGVEHIGQVRVNDNRGTHEEHLVPGEGNIDFQAVLTRLREMGYAGPFCFGFGDEAAKLRVRDTFLAS